MLGLKEIEIEYSYLTELKINKLNNLNKLNLWRSNNLKTVDLHPNLENLKLLELYSLDFPEFSHLQKLKYIKIRDVNMATFPECILSLKNLQDLRLDRISLDTLPDEFYLTNFPRLRALNLDKKYDDQIPAEFQEKILEKKSFGHEYR